MSSDLSILNLASALARHAAVRHRTIAENVSNADTPGFKAKDLPAFDATLAERVGSPARLDANGEGRELKMMRMMRAQEIDGAPTSPNGNNVAVDEQMANAVDAQSQHNAALAIYRKSMELLRLSFSTQR